MVGPKKQDFWPRINILKGSIDELRFVKRCQNPSITDGVHRKENFVEIIPVFSTFSKIFNNKIFFL